MPYSISRAIVAEPSQKIVSVRWTYSNADGEVGNTFDFAEPYGDVPLAECTEEIMISWLTGENGLINTTEEFDEHLAAEKARKEAESTLASYDTHADKGPTRSIFPEIPDEEEVAVAM